MKPKKRQSQLPRFQGLAPAKKGSMGTLTDLGHQVFQLELSGRSGKYPISGYLINAEKKVFIETGPSSGLPVLLEAIGQLGLRPGEIDGIIVTHVHLDHSGAVGLLAQHCPTAQVYVPPRGVKHLVDPRVLEQGARAVYGDAFDSLFAPLVPVAAERVVATPDRFELSLGRHRRLRFFDAPGHCLHHSFIWDSASQGIFTGDAAGMLYAELAALTGVQLCLPATTPVQFDPVAMKKTILAMKALNPEKIYYTHFGVGERAQGLLDQTLNWIDLYGSQAADLFRQTREVAPVATFLKKQIQKKLKEEGVTGPEGLAGLEFDCQLNAQGVAAFVAHQEKKSTLA